jgi:hypothetical protein
MSACGYKQTSRGQLANVRFTPESRHSDAQKRFGLKKRTFGVRFTPESGRIWVITRCFVAIYRDVRASDGTESGTPAKSGRRSVGSRRDEPDRPAPASGRRPATWRPAHPAPRGYWAGYWLLVPPPESVHDLAFQRNST